MSRRMVIRCDACGRQEDMPIPGAGVTSMFLGQTLTMQPQPPSGWLERYTSMRTQDFCSTECVTRWGSQP